MATVAGTTKERSGVSLAFGDAVATAFFVFVSSIFDEVRCVTWVEQTFSPSKTVNRPSCCQALQVADIIAAPLGLPGMVAGLSVLVAGLIIFGPVADWLGGPGALFNPSHNLAFAVLGDGKKRVHLMRMVCLP